MRTTDNSIEAYNNAADEYAKSRVGTEDSDELKKLHAYLSPGAKILDIGCAAGRDTRILKGMGFDAVGSDLADKLLDIARRENPDVLFVHADMRRLPFGDMSFDAVWASAVLHHVDKTEMLSVLQEFGRVLVPGGLLYIHTKAGSGKLQTHEKTVEHEAREFELLTAEELAKLLADAKFSELSLEVMLSKSRPGLVWLNAFYKRT